MMRVLPILLIAGITGAVSMALPAPPFAAPQPAPIKVAARTALVNATSFKIVVTFQLPGNPDSSLTRATNAGVGQAHRLPGSAVRDSFVVPVPAFGSTMSGSVCVQSKRRGLLSAETCAPWSFTMTDSPPPPPVIDSVVTDTLDLVIARLDVKPDALRLQAGQTQQMCGFVIFADGQVAERAVEQGNAVCDGFYTGGWPAAQRQPSAAQQAKADALCVHWTVTGGTVSLEPCDPLRGA